MRIGGRDVRRVLRAPMSRGHYRALGGMAAIYPLRELPASTRRFLTSWGEYPHTVGVRTPTGVVQVPLDLRDDLLTVNEIFARRDYAAPKDLQVAVDVGANIGIASLYFLTRNQTSRTYCVEPDPKNIARIHRTLGGFGDRYSIFEVAASDRVGEATFYVEPTGRYGGFHQEWKSESITVPTRPLADMIEEVLSVESRIDVLKVDTEGTEEELVGGLAPEHLDRITRIYYETDAAAPLHLDRYRHHFDCQTNALLPR